jgi:hypothetical protein
MNRLELRAIVLGFALAAVSSPACTQEAGIESPQRPGREVSLPRSQVEDAFFAYVLGIISTGVDVNLDSAQMRAILTEFNSALVVPLDLFDKVTQNTDEKTGGRLVGMEFTRDVDIPIPFTLLWYHPGSILSSQHLLWRVSRSWFFVPDNGGLVEAIDLVLSQGSVQVRLDEWLKVLFSAHFEDTWIHHIIFFRWKGHMMGLLAGAGKRTGRVLRAYFDFTKNGIIFPAPADLNHVGEILCNTPD